METIQQEISEIRLYVVETDKPSAGVFVPSDFYREEERVLAVMIEVNRRLYKDKARAEKLSAFNLVRAHLNQMLTEAENGSWMRRKGH